MIIVIPLSAVDTRRKLLLKTLDCRAVLRRLATTNVVWLSSHKGEGINMGQIWVRISRQSLVFANVSLAASTRRVRGGKQSTITRCVSSHRSSTWRFVSCFCLYLWGTMAIVPHNIGRISIRPYIYRIISGTPKAASPTARVYAM